MLPANLGPSGEIHLTMSLFPFGVVGRQIIPIICLLDTKFARYCIKYEKVGKLHH